MSAANDNDPTDPTDPPDPADSDASEAADGSAEATAALLFTPATSGPGGYRGGLSGQDAVVLAALPAGNALLVVPGGPGGGSRFLLDTDRVAVGRNHDSDIVLDGVSVSRRHAVVYRSAAGYRLKDVGSLNGTYLNGERIETEPLLAAGDEVQIGKYHLVYFPSPATSPGTASP